MLQGAPLTLQQAVQVKASRAVPLGGWTGEDRNQSDEKEDQEEVKGDTKEKQEKKERGQNKE